MIPHVLAAAALEDLDYIHARIAEDNIDAADRVQEAAFHTFELLSRNAEVGRVRKFHGKAKDLRSFGVSGFPNYVIFYRLRSNHLEIVRVLHGAQDVETILSAG
jgi:toxin ParE1/3/4